MAYDELASRRRIKQSRQSAAEALKKSLRGGYQPSGGKRQLLDTKLSTAYHEETGSWMHPFSDVRKDDEGFYILNEDNPDAWRMRQGDLIQDVALNQTPYWQVISNDQERVDLEPIPPNPLLTGVGAGGYVFQASDFKVLTGEYEQERVAKIIERLESGEQLQIYDVKYILLGTVPLNFGPNGPQGGWYNTGDTYSNRARGMSQEEIMMKDAETLVNMGFDVPEAAMTGRLDPYQWNNFIESPAQMFTDWLKVKPVDMDVFRKNYIKAPWLVEGSRDIEDILERANKYFKPRKSEEDAIPEEWLPFLIISEENWSLDESLEHPQEEVQMRAVSRGLMEIFSSESYKVGELIEAIGAYILSGDGSISVYDRLMEILGNYFPSEIAVPLLKFGLELESGYIRARIYTGLGMQGYKQLANYAFKEDDGEALKSIASALLRHGYMPGPGVVQHLLIRFAEILQSGSTYSRYYASDGIKNLLRLAHKQGVDTTEVLAVLDEYEAGLRHNPPEDFQDDIDWLTLSRSAMMAAVERRD